MKIAIIPSSNEYLKNKLFDIEDKNLNRDNLLRPYYDLKKKLVEIGWDINTYDVYENIEDADYIFFFSLNVKMIITCLIKNLENKMIYFAWEPEVVVKEHSSVNLEYFSKYFKFIFTWNDSIVDNKRIFKIYNPYHFEDIKLNKIDFNKKKLLVNISGNKNSSSQIELYSERLKVIKYFETLHSNEFDLYGIGWNIEEFKNYKGKVNNKVDVYQKYKFALSLENMKNIDGYVTEKIFDCFKAEIVPIYAGPPNIEKYIPKNTFINYNDFSSVEDLVNYLNSIDESKYLEYINNIIEFKKSNDIKKFDSKNFAQIIIDVVKNKNINFKIRLFNKFKFIVKLICNKIISKF